MTTAPAATILSLGYLRLASPRVEEWAVLATEVLGFMPVELATGPGFRWDDHPWRLALIAGEGPGIDAVGFEVADEWALAQAVAAVEAAGCTVTAGTAAGAGDRRVSGYASFTDPDGLAVELFHGPILDHVPLVTPLVSGFVTGAMGMGHVVLATDDAGRAVDFARTVFGFHQRNTWVLGDMAMHFLGCNPRHHTLAYGQGLGMPGKLIHFMVEVATIDDVGYAQDRCQDAGIPVVMGLGRHTNDRMISFYCATPDGSMVEIGWGGLEVEHPTTAPTYQITKPSFWGHRPLR